MASVVLPINGSKIILLEELDGFTSSSVEIECGVPQGSILGQLLYLMYANDIYNSCSGMILSFVNDTTIYSSNSNLNQLYHNANIQINKLFNWGCANKLSLNAGKTNYKVIRPKYMRCNLTGHDIFIQNTKLTRIGNDCNEKAIKVLGIYIDENLTWKYHLTNINKKISNFLFAIKQVK